MRYSLLHRFQGSICGSAIAEKLVSQSPEKLSDTNQIILDILPITIFFHDHPYGLREELESLWAPPLPPLEDALIWGEAIALALREKLDMRRFITQVLKFYRTDSSPLPDQLRQIEIFLKQATPLTQVVSQLSRQGMKSQTAIALAIYCFASTPEDFHLSVLRATQTGAIASLTTPLTAALSGAYNSFQGIPIAWRLTFEKEEMGRQCYDSASHLFTRWAGVYPTSEHLLSPSVAVASVRVMQPRSSLQLISQKEQAIGNRQQATGY